jgi:hypothetical protein
MLESGIKDIAGKRDVFEGDRLVGTYDAAGNLTAGIELRGYWSVNRKERNEIYTYVYASDPDKKIYDSTVDGEYQTNIKQFPSDQQAVIQAAKDAKSALTDIDRETIKFL